MGFEKRVLEVVDSVTDTPAYFFNGTLFLTTEDSKIAVKVLTALENALVCGVMFSKAGQGETYYDFVI